MVRHRIPPCNVYVWCICGLISSPIFRKHMVISYVLNVSSVFRIFLGDTWYCVYRIMHIRQNYGSIVELAGLVEYFAQDYFCLIEHYVRKLIHGYQNVCVSSIDHWRCDAKKNENILLVMWVLKIDYMI